MVSFPVQWYDANWTIVQKQEVTKKVQMYCSLEKQKTANTAIILKEKLLIYWEKVKFSGYHLGSGRGPIMLPLVEILIH